MLVRTLDADSAAVLLAQLSSEEAKAVRQAIRELGDVDPLEQEELRRHLRPQRWEQEPLEEGGVELDLTAGFEQSLLDIAQIPATPDMLNHESTLASQPFAWLERGDLPSLAAMLEREHLSTVAVVLSHLPPERASEVLTALPPYRRAAAIERLADLGESDRASLEVIERELADWIAAQKAARQRRTDRLQSIQAILKHSSRKTCDAVLAEIGTHDKALAKEIGHVQTTIADKQSSLSPRPLAKQAQALREQPQSARAQPVPMQRNAATEKVDRQLPPPPPSFAFENLAYLDGRQIADLFSHCSGEQVVLALAGSSQQLVDHVERLLPKRVVKELRRRMHSLSAVKLSDFTKAQHDIARTASRLFGDAPSTS